MNMHSNLNMSKLINDLRINNTGHCNELLEYVNKPTFVGILLIPLPPNYLKQKTKTKKEIILL